MLCALGAMDCASPRLREVEGSTLGGNKTLNFFVFRFPIFLNAFFTGICFFFIRNVAFFKTENGILEANYRRKLLQQRLHMRPLRMMTMFPDGLTATTTRN